MTNYVKFLRGTPAAYEALTIKDKDTLYFIVGKDDNNNWLEVGKLYLGDILVAGNITADGDSVIDTLGELSDVNIAGALNGQILGFNGTAWIPMNLPEAFEASIMTGATNTTNGTEGYVPAPKMGDEGKFLRGDGTWVEVITNLSDYVKQTDFNQLSTRVDTLEEIGAEKNIIQTVDVGTLNITEDRKLELKAVPQHIITGLEKTSWTVQEVENGDDIFIAQTTVANLADILKPATFDPITKTGTSGLMTAEQVQKLQALVITDEGIQVSGKVNADNIEGLASWITTNRDIIPGLYPVEAKNLLDSLNTLVTDETNGLNKKVGNLEKLTAEQNSKIAILEKAMTWEELK